MVTRINLAPQEDPHTYRLKIAGTRLPLKKAGLVTTHLLAVDSCQEWTDDNRDGDHDRMRKKHSEFLVKDHIPVQYIKTIVVLTEDRKAFVENLIGHYELPIAVHLDTKYKFYYR